MKILTTLYLLLIASLGLSQYSDTMTCNNLSYAVHYSQQHCIDSCDGSATIEILSGSGNYEYNWSASNSAFTSSDQSLTNLCPDEYTCVVADLTTMTYCTMIISIDTLQTLETSIAVTDCSMTDLCDGSAVLGIEGGVPPYHIQWYDSNQQLIPMEDSIVLENLCDGWYYYLVTDSSPNCAYTEPCDTCPIYYCDTCDYPGFTNGLTPFYVGEGLLVSEVYVMPETCPWSCDGMIQVTASGGTGEYTYMGPTGSNSTGFFEWACPGTYTIQVEDSEGNSGEIEVIVEEAEPIYFTAEITHETCAGSCDGIITLDDWMGNIQEYSLDSWTWQQSNVIDNLCPGTYIVFARNYNYCIEQLTVVINEGTNVEITSLEVEGDCLTNIFVEGGQQPYTYIIDNTMPLGTLPACGFSPGTHTVCVTESSSGCWDCEPFEIVDCSNVTVEPIVENVFCAENCDGQIQLMTSGLTGNMTINWYYGGTSYTQGPAMISQLCPGEYSYDIIDENNCTVEGTVQVLAPEPITVFASSSVDGCNPCNGTLTIAATGGSENFEYSINSFDWSTNGYYSDLCADIYVAEVRDDQGCTGYYSIEVENSDPVNVVANVTNPYDDGSCNGTISATGNGGTPPYMYQWIACNQNQPVIETVAIAENLCAGEYYVIVTDANGCSDTSECMTIQSTASINTVTSTNWSVYPNPTSKNIHIKAPNTDSYTIDFIDLTGKVIFTSTVSGNYTTTIDKLKLSRGSYFISIHQGGKTTTQKLIIH